MEGRRSVSLDAERNWGVAGVAADLLDGCHCRSRGVEGNDEPDGGGAEELHDSDLLKV